MMNRLLCLLSVITALSVPPARADEELPPDIRWRANEMTFFVSNTGGGTTAFYHGFVNATQRWQPGNFSINVSGNAANNAACRDRRPGIPVVNIASLVGSVPMICGEKAQFTPRTLAVTVVGWGDDKAIRRADIFFASSRTWGIYDGPLYQPPHYIGRPDFRRVAVHELGHAAGLSHALFDSSAIMFPEAGDVYQPSADDTARLRVKYATPLPPAPSPGPGDFACPPQLPFQPIVDLGTLSTTTYRLGQCLDAGRPQTIYYFDVISPRQIRLGLGADTAEMNVILSSQAGVIWSAINTGESAKATTRTFVPGRYSVRVWPRTAGSSFNLVFEFQ